MDLRILRELWGILVSLLAEAAEQRDVVAKLLVQSIPGVKSELTVSEKGRLNLRPAVVGACFSASQSERSEAYSDPPNNRSTIPAEAQ